MLISLRFADIIKIELSKNISHRPIPANISCCLIPFPSSTNACFCKRQSILWITLSNSQYGWKLNPPTDGMYDWQGNKCDAMTKLMGNIQSIGNYTNIIFRYNLWHFFMLEYLFIIILLILTNLLNAVNWWPTITSKWQIIQ